MRILIAALAGALAMFVWVMVAHTLTPLGSMGLRPMPAEATTLQALHLTLGDKPGFYAFPSEENGPGGAAGKADHVAKLKNGPSGLLIYHPPGTPAVTFRQVGLEFVLALVEALLVTLSLGLIAGAPRRLGGAVLIGLVAATATNLAYWNWYGFAGDYTLAAAFTELVKFALAGAVITPLLAWRRGLARGMR